MSSTLDSGMCLSSKSTASALAKDARKDDGRAIGLEDARDGTIGLARYHMPQEEV